MKPAVDRLESRIKDECKVVRISVHSELCTYIKNEFGSNTVPTFLFFDSKGREHLRKYSVPTYVQIMDAIDTQK